MTKSNGQNALNPIASARSLRDATLDAWSKTLIEAVNTDTFAQWLGAYLNTALAVSEPFQRAVDQSMQAVLPRLNLPSRDELAMVSRRMTNIEMRLDDLDVRLDEILDAARAPAPAPVVPPPVEPLLDARLTAIEARLDALLAALQAAPSKPAPPARPARRPARKTDAATSEQPAE